MGQTTIPSNLDLNSISNSINNNKNICKINNNNGDKNNDNDNRNDLDDNNNKNNNNNNFDLINYNNNNSNNNNSNNNGDNNSGSSNKKNNNNNIVINSDNNNDIENPILNGNVQSQYQWHYVSYAKENKINKRKNDETIDGILTNEQIKAYTFTVGSADNDEISAANFSYIKKSYIYLGNINKKITLEEIQNYLNKRKIKPLGLYKLNRNNKSTKDKYDSYKLIIERNLFPVVLNPSFWPKGITIKPWLFYPPASNMEPPNKKSLLSTSLIADNAIHSQVSTDTAVVDKDVIPIAVQEVITQNGSQ